jgi:hypothetical protein
VYLFQRGAAAWPAFKTNDTSLCLYLSWARNDLRKVDATAPHASPQQGARKHAATAAAVAAAAANASTARTSLHTPAQAALMAAACPPHLHRESKRAAAVPSPCAAFVATPQNQKSVCEIVESAAARPDPLASAPAKRARRAAPPAASDAAGGRRASRQRQSTSSPHFKKNEH